MKIGGRRNYGYGKSMKFAVRNLLQDKFGSGRFETRRTHLARLRLFLEFIKGLGVSDLRRITEQFILLYANYLRELIENDELAVSTGQNRLSSVNVLMGLLPSLGIEPLNPSEHLGKRNYVRTDPPSGLSLVRIKLVVTDLLNRGEPRLALTIGLCRGIGCRFREASLMHPSKALRHARSTGNIVVSRGTKGGRGRKIPRVLSAPHWLVELLEAAIKQGVGRSVVPENMTYIRWYGAAHREWSKRCLSYGLNSRFHDLRCSYACEEHEFLTGKPAPCVEISGVATILLPADQRLSESDARDLIAGQMGHGRSDVLNSYCGSRW